MEKKTFRKDLESAIENRGKKSIDLNAFADTSISKDERIQQERKVSKEEVLSGNKLLRNVAHDQQQELEVRLRAIELLEHTLDSEETINALFEILEKEKHPVILKRAIEACQKAAFVSRYFVANRSRYIAALRNLVGTEDKELQQIVIGVLAAQKDEFVQRILLEGLKDPKSALVSTQQAIQLLGYDIHAEFYPILRNIAENSKNQNERMEAIRHLGGDKQGEPLIAKFLTDRNENPKIREESAISLQISNPETFNNLAVSIIEDEDETDGLRAITLSAKVSNIRPLIDDDNKEVTDLVKRLYTKSKTGDQLKKVAEKYLKGLSNE